MRMTIVVASLLAALASPAWAQTKVYVFTAIDPSGLTDADGKKRVEATEGVKQYLGKNKAVALVPTAEEAKVTVEITGIWKSKTTGTTSDTRRGVFGGLRTETKDEHETFDYATIASGTYRMELETSSFKQFGKSHPGEQLTKQIEKWLKENAEALR